MQSNMANMMSICMHLHQAGDDILSVGGSVGMRMVTVTWRLVICKSLQFCSKYVHFNQPQLEVHDRSIFSLCT